ncbi:MAG TPA: LolA-related protein [Burkholderiales bacterium]|nr:LolA-related protein [Burkholderiales bacterium]
MISGASPCTGGLGVARVLIVAGFCGCAAGASGADAPEGWNINRLMRDLAQVDSARARFVERKELAMLSAPLESSGTLVYTAPDRLEKRTLKPREENLLLEGERLTLESKARNQRRTFALREQPVIGAFVEGIRSTLAGDLATLRRYYRVSLEGSERQWRLMLEPVDPGMQNVISEIRIGGSGTWIDTIDIVESNGDRSVMTITRDEAADAPR